MAIALINKIWQDRQGQDMTEYALIGGLVASMIVVVAPELAAIADHFTEVVLTVTKAVATLSGME
jgi:Flp pilus assembly pilin Flp